MRGAREYASAFRSGSRMRITGSCHCGQLAYEAEIDPDDVIVCHCTDCQRLTGTDYRVTVGAKADDLRIIRGALKLYAKTADNGRRRLQYFCPECGSPIYTTGENADAREISIRTGTIDQRGDLPPRRQIWCSSSVPWLGEVGGLPGRPRD